MSRNIPNTSSLTAWFQKPKLTPKPIDEQLGGAAEIGDRKKVIKLLEQLKKLAIQQAATIESVAVMGRMAGVIVPMICAAANKHKDKPSKDWHYISLFVFAFGCRYQTQLFLSNPEIFSIVVPDTKYPKALAKPGADPLKEVLDGLVELVKKSTDLKGLDNDPLVQIIPPLAKRFGQCMYEHKIFQLVKSNTISSKAGWAVFHGMFTACTYVGHDDCQLSKVALRNKELGEEIFRVLIEKTCVPILDLIKIIQQYSVEIEVKRSASEPDQNVREISLQRASSFSF